MRFLREFNEMENFAQAESSDRKGVLLFYAFDWDDNILNMPTEIMVQTKSGNEIGMSTADFAIYRSKVGKEEFEYKGETIIGLDYSSAFRNFRDEADPEIFRKDVEKALSMKSFAPAWKDFIECLTNGSIFAIITARGHEAEGMRKGVEFVIDSLSQEEKSKMHDSLLMFHHLFDTKREEEGQESFSNFSKSELVKDYLDLCHFVGVSAPSRGGSPANPEAAKEKALKDFITDVNEYASEIGYAAKVGFSDDDPGNVRHITHALSSEDLDHEKLWPFVDEFVIKDTNLPSNVVKTSIPTRESLKTFEEFKESMDPMAASTMSMQTPNAAMSAGMDSKEPFVTRSIGQSKLLAKLSKRTFEKSKRKNKK
jgi:hypothetical protein